MERCIVDDKEYFVIEGNYYTQLDYYYKGGGNTGLLPTRITPSVVNVLKENEIFVFGSNFQGKHIGGAARTAKENFGAVWGIGEGLQGKSYAIPTMEGIDNLIPAIERFASFAKQHQEFKFYVTAIGCGIAGHNAEDVAPYFLESSYLPNVYLPVSFWVEIQRIANSDEEVEKAMNSMITLVTFSHRNNRPGWNESVDRKMFYSLEAFPMWILGVALKVISPGAKFPMCKVLPSGVSDLIYEALKKL